MTKSLTPYTDQFSFNGKEHREDTDFDALKRAIVDEVVLPAYFTFDEPKNVYEVNVKQVEPEIFVITILDPNGKHINAAVTSSDDLEQAYDIVRNQYFGDVKFTGDIEAYTGSNEKILVSVPSKNNPSFSRLLIGAREEDHTWFDKSQYYEFLKRSNRYVKNPNDFATAFRWLDGHPAFWYRYPKNANNWNKNSISKVWVDVTTDTKGNTVVMLEHGAAVEPARTQHYHDNRLDVYAPTYEQAIIELAALVHKFYDVDGSERPEVDYEKSELEVILEEKMEQIALLNLKQE